MKPGVYSEVGKLRQVLVCSPGLAHARLTPANCDELLFDDVLWIEKAQQDHLDIQLLKTKKHSNGCWIVESPTTA